jgi:quinol monooxygenase YgiN
MVIVHVSVPIKAAARSRWLAISRGAHRPHARLFRSYQVYEDIDAQNGLYRHFQAPHFTEFFAALGDMLAGPPEGSVREVASTLTIDDALRASGVTA